MGPSVEIPRGHSPFPPSEIVELARKIDACLSENIAAITEIIKGREEKLPWYVVVQREPDMGCSNTSSYLLLVLKHTDRIRYVRPNRYSVSLLEEGEIVRFSPSEEASGEVIRYGKKALKKVKKAVRKIDSGKILTEALKGRKRSLYQGKFAA